jgi:hypothetical protein
MNSKQNIHISTFTCWVRRYEAYGTSLAARCIVAPPRHGTTMPRCRALPHTAMNMHYAPSNSGFQVKGELS